MHCFGHMHANWGAKKVAWREEKASEEPSHFTDIDNDESTVIETLSTLRAGKFDSAGDADEKKERKARYERQGFCGALNLKLKVGGMESLFVNAAIEDEADDDQHLPWVIDIELPRAKEESATATTSTDKKRKRSDDDDSDNDSDRSSKRVCVSV